MSRYREAMLELERLKREKKENRLPPRHVQGPTGMTTSVDTPEVTDTQFGIDAPDVHEEEDDS